MDAALMEVVPSLAASGVTAFTTTRQAGSFGLTGAEASSVVWGRWLGLAAQLGAQAPRLAFAHQVHGTEFVVHQPAWVGILRVPDADGHLGLSGSTAMAVTLADCVPVFIGHPSGVAGVMHSGWKGTAGGITRRAIAHLVSTGLDVAEVVVHCGPSICGACYEVGPEVHLALTGGSVSRPTPVDLRAIIAADARAAGVRDVTISPWCTRCHNDRFFSHRCGDDGRQLGVIASFATREHRRSA